MENKGGDSGNCSALALMIDLASKETISPIGLPRIGAGIGGLEWPVVKELLVDAGEHSVVRLVIFENYVLHLATRNKQTNQKKTKQ